MSKYDISQLAELNPWWVKKEAILGDKKLRDIANKKYP